MSDSIQYASYIQSAIMPLSGNLSKIFPESFILFQPKNVVSGDFYWFLKRRNTIIITAADCTGHGVPGAFMSILGMTFINDIINRDCTFTANGILNQLRERVMKALHQTGEGGEQKDGMDIALCIIDKELHELQFAGAFNPLYLFRKDKFIEIKGDRMPIGVHATEEISFTNHVIKLQNNDIIYLFTDGYSDQFGGPKEKKFKYIHFKKLLHDIKDMPMEKQKQTLFDTFTEWKEYRDQVDDILIMGFKYLHK